MAESTPVSSPPSQLTQFNQLWSFLEYFNYSLITLSIQPEKGITPGSLDTPGISHFSPLNRIRAFSIDELRTDTLLTELQLIQSLGYAIYFMVNEGDGSPKDTATNNLNCGRRANVAKLKALFIDQDNASFDALKSRLIELHLMPHLVVQTSPKKHHLYFLIHDEPADPQNILYWEALQKYLDDLVPELDQSMTDINQILRLPLFYNLKPEVKPAHRVSVRLWPDFKKIPLYSLKSLFDRFELHKAVSIDKLYVNGSSSSLKENYNKFEFPLHTLKEGERRTVITRYIEHLMENVLPLEAKAEDYFILIDGFINKYLEEKDRAEFLTGGRRKNLEQYLEDQRGFRLRKRAESDARGAIEELEQIEKVEKGFLDDSFYLGFPGDVGLLVREVHAYDPDMPMELVFAGCLCVLGALKCERFRLYDSWPFINGLVIADPGVGKSTMKGVIEQILKSAGFSGKFNKLIPFQLSVLSLLFDWSAAGGAGVTIVDESGGYLKALSSQNSPAYITELKDYYKNSTTGSDKGNLLSPGRSLSFKVSPIYGGMLSLWMLIQPDRFTDTMSYSDLADGFLPRFFVFEGKEVKVPYVGFRKGRPTFTCGPELLAMVQGYAGLLNEEAIQIEVAEEMIEFKKNNPKAKRDEIAFHEISLVHERRKMFRQREDNVIKVTVDADAEEEMNRYFKIIHDKTNKLEPESTEKHIYKRVQEMLMRLLCCCSHYDFNGGKAWVDLELVRKCIEFQQFQFERFFNNRLTDVINNGPEKEEQMVIKAIKKYMLTYREFPSVSEVTKMLKSSKRPANIGEVIRRLLFKGEIEEVIRGHKRKKDKKVRVYKIADAE